jgi:hypothetical protein
MGTRRRAEADERRRQNRFTAEQSVAEISQPPCTVKSDNNQFPLFFLSEDVLQDIFTGLIKVPRTASKEQIDIIREYITHAVGLDPKRLLLGINSYMEPGASWPM